MTEKGLEMKLARFRDGTADSGTPGKLVGHGRSYDVLHHTSSSAAADASVFTRLAALSSVRPGDRVLDVGCGNGYFTRVMAEAVTSGGAPLGVDPPER